MPGKIIFVGVDLGNINDITKRALDALTNNKIFIVEHKDLFLHKLNLLKITDNKEIYEWPGNSLYDITKIITTNIFNGMDIVYCSEEGMPSSTDPGSQITRIALDNNIQYTVFPGPSISSTMPILSGFCCNNFIYKALIPMESYERIGWLKELYQTKLPFISVCPSKNSKEIKQILPILIKDIIDIFSDESMITLCFNLTHENELIISNTAKMIAELINKIEFDGLYLLSLMVVPKEALNNCA